MHRSYQSVLPCQSKLLQSRWDRQYYDNHIRKVQSAGSMVDTRPPQTYLHVHLKMKKLQLEGERLATIERDNRILLEKMSYVMRTQGRIDNKNDYDYKSLNREKRQRELMRIAYENHGVLKRIMMRQPEYDRFKWQLDWEENLRYIDMISSYPREWWLMTEAGRRKYAQEQGDTSKNAKKDSRTQSSQSGKSASPSTRSLQSSEKRTKRKKKSTVRDLDEHKSSEDEAKAKEAERRLQEDSRRAKEDERRAKEDERRAKEDERRAKAKKDEPVVEVQD